MSEWDDRRGDEGPTSKVSKAEQWARGETKNSSYSQSGYSITVPERALSELVSLRDELTESNRQLREELERVKKDAMVPNHENMTYKALFGIMERDLQAKLKSEREKAAVTQRALAVAKHALQTCRCLEPEQRQAVANALARIAECENQ